MKLSPNQIYKDFKEGNLEKKTALNQLFTFITNSDDMALRLESIETLQKISPNEKVFHLFENLLISDSNEEVRIAAIKAIENNYIEKAFKPIKWAFQHENSISCLIAIVSTLGKINNDKAKSFLIDKIKKIDIYEFNKSLKGKIENGEMSNLTHEKLSDILKNYIVIDHFKKNFKDIDFHVNDGLVTSLNLSGISNDVFGWRILRHLREFISVLKYLKNLDLKINRIAKLPKNIGNLHFLTHLDLSNNNLKSLPESIGALNSLEFLYLKYNKIVEIPNSIGALKKLKTLDLRHNNLISLPYEIYKLKSLEILDLHGNKLNNLPKSIEGLKSLKTLELGLNKLINLPDWIKNLQSLKKLGLGGNKTSIDFSLLSNLISLSELNLYDNNIKVLPAEVGILNSLETLILRNNKLSDLPESFKNLGSLRKLDLSWNNLTTLPEWIDSLSSLEQLNLWGNNLKSLPSSIGNLSSLKILNLNFNKFIRKIPESLEVLQNKGLKIYK
jgi:Leucine-rich repeat (LRR) protein